MLSGWRVIWDPNRWLIRSSTARSHPAFSVEARHSRICLACIGHHVRAARVPVSAVTEAKYNRQAQIWPELLVAADALVIVDRIAAAIQDQPARVDLDRAGVGARSGRGSRRPGVDEPVGEADLVR